MIHDVALRAVLSQIHQMAKENLLQLLARILFTIYNSIRKVLYFPVANSLLFLVSHLIPVSQEEEGGMGAFTLSGQELESDGVYPILQLVIKFMIDPHNVQNSLIRLPEI